jgi:hypothetical protein
MIFLVHHRTLRDGSLMDIAPRVFPRTHAGRPFTIPDEAGHGYNQPKRDDTGGVNADAVVESEDYDPGARGSEVTNPCSR